MSNKTSISVHQRIIKLQRQILLSIRADVRRVIGVQPRTLVNYYNAYKREFTQTSRHSSKDELIKACLRADIVLVGDYHTFSQSQRAFLRLIREMLTKNIKICIGLEMVRSSDQGILDLYLEDKITEEDYLEKTKYVCSWGFPWSSFKSILDLSKQHKVKVIALNSNETNLTSRDIHCAEILINTSTEFPELKIFALYGDLHLARSHIPKHIQKKAKLNNHSVRLLTVFQNSESLYWRLAKNRLEHSVDVLKLPDNRFCIMNAAPWVKLQSYLQWAEAGGLFENDTTDNQSLHDRAHEWLKVLTSTIELPIKKFHDFTIFTISDLSFFNHPSFKKQLRKSQLKAFEYHVLSNRTIYVPSQYLCYLSSSSVNATCDAVSQMVYDQTSGNKIIYNTFKNHYFNMIIRNALTYFGCKVLNHKRKCDLEADYRSILKLRARKSLLTQELIQLKAAKIIVSQCENQIDYVRGKKNYYTPRLPEGKHKNAVLFEVTRGLGFILGEKLYALFIEGQVSLQDIKRFYKANLKNQKLARDCYLKLISTIGHHETHHESKKDLL